MDYESLSHDLRKERGFATLIIEQPSAGMRQVHEEIVAAMGHDFEAECFVKVTRSKQFYTVLALWTSVNRHNVLTDLCQKMNKLFLVATGFSETQTVY